MTDLQFTEDRRAMAGVYEFPRIFTFTSEGSKGDKSMKELVGAAEVFLPVADTENRLSLVNYRRCTAHWSS
jgi:hypothetical protein